MGLNACPETMEAPAPLPGARTNGEQKPLRVLLVHQYPIVLAALKNLVQAQGQTVIGEATSRADAARLAENFQPDLAIVHFELPFADLHWARAILQVSPATRIILLAKHSEEYHAREAARLGVKGYVLQTKDSEEIFRTIAEVSRGCTCFSPEASRAICPGSASDLADPLTMREKQVVTLIAEGNSTKEIALALGISFKTADSHRSRIINKLNLHETASLVRYAVRRGLVEA